ncbi:hypothetical protein BGZ76_008152 [Entomortierella beljakovae]|nr:hypothetical protein BGZ76_008152 [Entomortierella beljakovae]
MSELTHHSDTAEHIPRESTPSYSDIQTNGVMTHAAFFEHNTQESPYLATRSMDVDPHHGQPQHTPITHTSVLAGLLTTLELESDTIEIYDRSNDGFQYSLKGSLEFDWSGNSELLLKDARIDFVGYADTALLRYEAGSSFASETPVHHTHDFIPTPLVLTSNPIPSTSGGVPTNHHKSIPIDLTLTGNLPDSINIDLGKIRYELQASIEVAYASGTSASTSEMFILRRPVFIHRIVYPSAHLQPRVSLGLDSGGVEIQTKVPRFLHCENNLLAVELYVKPRARNVKLRKARIVFEQIETDRCQRSSPTVAIPKAVVPLAIPTHPSSSPSFSNAQLPTPQSAGPPPAPRLMTRIIAQPLEVEFEEPTMELQTQNLNLQLVLSPELCVDVQSSWIQVSHLLRVEVEYTADDESYIISPPTSAPPVVFQEFSVREDRIDGVDQESAVDTSEPAPSIWNQEGDAIETDIDSNVYDESIDLQLALALNEKKIPLGEEGTGSSTANVRDYGTNEIQGEDTANAANDINIISYEQSKDSSKLASLEPMPSNWTNSLATEEIPVRVVRVVSTALVDASTLAQAAGETEAGLPTYESVIEATGLPAYAEEKLEDDHEEAEASGTVTGVLGGAARRLEGEDAELERR